MSDLSWLSAYKNPQYTGSGDKYLPQDEFCKAKEALVIATVDILIHSPNNEKILITKPNTGVCKGFWSLQGTRMVNGDDSIGATASRHLQTELGIDTCASSFREVRVYSAKWEDGSHYLTVLLSLELTIDEMQAVKIYSSKYHKVKCVNIRQAVVSDEVYSFYRRCLSDWMIEHLLG